MDIGEIVSDSVKFPSSNWKNVIILGILFILSIVIIPGFLAMGYVFRIVKSSIAGSDELPDFEEWGEMFVDGLKVFVVGLAYFIIPFIVIFIGIWASISAMIVQSTGTISNPTAFLGLMGGTMILGMILALIFGLIAMIAIANMALYDSELGAAFRFGEILERISMIGWGSYILWYIVIFIVIGFVASIISGILSIIPILGTIIAFLIVYPYYYMLIARSLALIFASSEEGSVDTSSEEASVEE
jgi:hypothetical protein